MLLSSRLALVAGAFPVVSVLGLDHPASCISNPDHSNYGLQSDGAFCQWDSNHFFKPAGVGCKTDAECVPLKWPFTNGKDRDSIDADIVLNHGVMYCDHTNLRDGATECFIGIYPPPNHAGRQPGEPDPPKDITGFCREVISKDGFPDVKVLTGCFQIPGDYKSAQCIWTCNGSSTACDKGDDPNTPHRWDTSLPWCPGYGPST